MNYLAVPGFMFRPEIRHASKDFPEMVSRLAAEELGVKWELIFTPSRKQGLVYCRNISSYLIRKHSRLFSMAYLASYFGGKNHGTIVHGIQSVKDMMKYNERFAKTVDNIETAIYNFQ